MQFFHYPTLDYRRIILYYIISINFNLFLFKAEELDTNSHLHGNWNLANAKPKLHDFLNHRKMSADFQYFADGPDHARYTKLHGSLKYFKEFI